MVPHRVGTSIISSMRLIGQGAGQGLVNNPPPPKKKKSSLKYPIYLLLAWCIYKSIFKIIFVKYFFGKKNIFRKYGICDKKCALVVGTMKNSAEGHYTIPAPSTLPGDSIYGAKSTQPQVRQCGPSIRYSNSSLYGSRTTRTNTLVHQSAHRVNVTRSLNTN